MRNGKGSSEPDPSSSDVNSTKQADLSLAWLWAKVRGPLLQYGKNLLARTWGGATELVSTQTYWILSTGIQAVATIAASYYAWHKLLAPEHDKDIPEFPNSLDDIIKQAKRHADDTTNERVHQDQINSIHDALGSKMKNIILVTGPRNAGKTWTTQFALTDFTNDDEDKERKDNEGGEEDKKSKRSKERKKPHVLWVKGNGISSVTQLCIVIEEAIGFKWDEPNPRDDLFRMIFPNSAHHFIRAPPKDNHERLRKVLRKLGDYAENRRASNDEPLVLLLDDFESRPSIDQADVDLCRAFDMVTTQLSYWAQDGKLRSIVVSSDPNIKRFFGKDHIHEVHVGWLNKQDIETYVRGCFQKAAQDNSDEKTQINDIAEFIYDNTGRLMADVRGAVFKFKQEQAKTPTAAKEKSEQALNNDSIDKAKSRIGKEMGKIINKHLDDLEYVIHARHYPGLRALFSKWKPWQSPTRNQTSDVPLSVKERIKLDGDARRGLDALIEAGAVFKDDYGTIHTSSFTHREALHLFSQMINSSWWWW